MTKRDHGTWYYYVKLPDGIGGQRRRPRKGGFLTQKKAKEEAQKLWDEAQGGIDVESKETVAHYLNRWHDKRVDLKRRTRTDYRDFIDRILIPALGHLPMRELRDRQIQEMFKQIWAFNEIKEANRIAAQQAKAACGAAHQAWKHAPKPRSPELRQAWHQAREELKAARTKPRQDTGPGTQKKYLDCLSAALADAVTEKLITDNWAKLVTIPKYERPEALVWTDERVARWKITGEKPSPVMVWTPEQTGEFLDAAVEHDHYVMWHLMAFRAPRRGEATGLPWTELDMTKGVAHISEQLVTDSTNTVWEDTPKSRSGRRAVTLDYATFALLIAWRDIQKAQRAEWEAMHLQWLKSSPEERQALKAYDHPYSDSGKVFTQPDGRPHHPKNISQAFDRFIKRLGLPPIRLHDLRHCAASLSLAAGLSMKAIQALLGHSSYQLTADTYTSLMPQFEQASANAPLDLVPRRNGIDKPADAQSPAIRTDATPVTEAAPAPPDKNVQPQIQGEPQEPSEQQLPEGQQQASQPSRGRGHLRLVSSVPRNGTTDAA
ncbi:tyrosine-type recombinase/integrase [Streptomyces sp. NBC_01381]|uniref:tyrosine-type recombinase/integrase n=1 Tax=Streptomyces sp. NBC_01381 TaxID=2903845 RepID=UPI002254A321|nr:tyrosine-type recombinase/integrase [Streptomyces sp. NBC_01381]